MKKKMMAMMLALFMIISMVQIIPAKAATGNSMNNAISASTEQTYSGTLNSSTQKKYYKFTLSSSGEASLIAKATIYNIQYRVYDSNGNELWGESYYQDNTTGMSSIDEKLNLTSGTYYLVVDGEGYKGNYNFKISFKSAGETFKETGNGNNNSMWTANTISFGNTYKGQIAINDEKDFYKFVMPSSGRLKLNAYAKIYRVNYNIYDENGNSVWDQGLYKDDVTGQSALNEDIDLTKGTYYLAVNASYDTTGTYSFKTSFQSAGESFTESGNGTNNSLQNANSISIGSKYTGQIAENDEKDIYKLTLNTSKKLTLNYSSRLGDTEMYIYNRDGKVVWNKYNSKDDKSGLNIIKEQISLSAGTYYFVVDKTWSSTGPYTFGFYQYTSISSASITLGSQRYVYDGYAKKPKVTVKYKSKVLKNGKDYTVSYSSNKYVGTAKVKITGKESFNGSKTQTFVIVPKATKIKKLKGQKNGFIIQVVPQKTQTTAYEMQCSTNSKFKKASRYVISNKYKKVSIKTLKRKKKYYVRIRTYKTKGEWNYLSSWSPVKTVKTK